MYLYDPTVYAGMGLYILILALAGSIVESAFWYLLTWLRRRFGAAERASSLNQHEAFVF